MVQSKREVPTGYKELKEGQANILYIEEKMEVGEDNKIKSAAGVKGGKNINEVNETRGAVFYNPVQEFNRDISILTINEFNEVLTEERAAKGKEHEGISVLEALAATGLRSVRYSKEIPSIIKLVANDILPAATDLMKKNFEHNDCDAEKIEVTTADAIDLMHAKRAERQFFNVVDLDPYGSANPFLEGALSCIHNGGLLCVTFTDMAVLCARQPHVCFYKYGAAPLGKNYCHEMALRMVLYMINTMANKHGRQIEPMMSLTVDFYIRLFIRVKDQPKECHKSISRYSSVHQCLQCESFYLQKWGHHLIEEVTLNEKGNVRKREAKWGNKNKEEGKPELGGEQKEEVQQKEEEEPEQKQVGQKDKTKIRERYVVAKTSVPSMCGSCGNALHIGGPIWHEKIHNIDFVKRLHARIEATKDKYGTSGRIKGILGGIIDEEPLSHKPLSYDFSTVQSQLKMVNMQKKEVIAGFRSLGYLVGQTYYNHTLWKTNAPPEAIYDIFKQYKKEKYGEDYLKNCNEKSLPYIILNREIKTPEANFDYAQVQQQVQQQKVLRKYFVASEPNWGPKSRATGQKRKEE